MTNLDSFTSAYIECALWAESACIGDCDHCDEEVMTDGNDKCAKCGADVSGTDLSFEQRNRDTSDLAEETLQSMVADCSQFQADNAELLEKWYSECGESEERAGHDFWLTRNHHGAGFWDRWNSATPQGKIGDKLSDAAHSFGEVSLYLGDDEKIYQS